MKKSIELKEQRSDVISKLEAISTAADAVKEELTTEQTAEIDTLLKEADEIEAKISRAEKLEANLRTAAAVSGTKIEPQNDKDLNKFTFQAAMRAALTGKVEGIVKEMDQEARNEARYTGQTYKGIAIPASILTRTWLTAESNSVDTQSWTDQLESNLVLASAGANFYGGVNDLKFPIFSDIASTWVSEDGSSGAAAAAGNTTSVTLSPKKLISVVNMTQESIVQNASLESALQANMARQMAGALEFALLDTADVSNAPLSIFADATAGPTTVLAADWIEMETDTLAAGVQLEGARMAYLLDMDAYKIVKTLATAQVGIFPIWDNADKRLNGYYAFASANVANAGTSAKGHALFGDFGKVHIAQFGGLDLLFDPYTTATTGIPRMIVTGLFDGDAVQNASFTKLIEA
tara:strand:+ start:3992 stop:5212 length:1221 start_codon:yes stop_codon:yes gene_type:complete